MDDFAEPCEQCVGSPRSIVYAQFIVATATHLRLDGRIVRKGCTGHLGREDRWFTAVDYRLVRILTQGRPIGH